MKTESRKEYRKKYMAEYRSRPEYRSAKARYRATWLATSKGKVYQANYRKTSNGIKKLRQYNQEPKTIFRRYAAGARRRGLDFGLSYEQFMSFWQKPCHYCGMPIKTIGLDRMDNEKGYVEGNVVSCCITHNRMKMGMTPMGFVMACAEVINHFRMSAINGRKNNER